MVEKEKNRKRRTDDHIDRGPPGRRGRGRPGGRGFMMR